VQQAVERVRHSFRREGPAIVGGRPSYVVSASDGRVSIRPVTRQSQSNERAKPRERTTRRRPQPVVGAALELETVAAGRRGALLELGTTPEVDPAGDLELGAREVVERLESRDQGLEVSWSFPARPRGAGDLEVRVHASGLEPAGETPSGLHFRDPATGLGLRIGVATWIDAKGERTLVTERFDGSEITFVVPAETVESSSFPATLDPVIGPEHGVDTPVTGPASDPQRDTAVAYSGSGYLAAWTDDRPGSFEQVFATRISSTGAVLDPNGIAVSSLGLSSDGPAVTFDGTSFLVAYAASDGLVYGRRIATTGALVDAVPFAIINPPGGSSANGPVAAANAGGTTLVVWEDFRSGLGPDIYGARVSGSTALDPNGIGISTNAGDEDAPSLAYNGSNWLVVWEDDRSGTSSDVYGARVSTAGAVLDSAATGIAISAGAADETHPKVASNGSASFVVWEDQRNAATTSIDIYGARVSTAGAVLDASGIQVTNNTGAQFGPGVAYDGANYTVVWLDEAGVLYGNRVSAAGALLNGAGGAAVSGAPSTTFFGAISLAPAGAATYLVWDQIFGGASAANPYGSRLSTALAMVDAPGVLLASSANGEKETAIAAGPQGQWLAVWHDDRGDQDAIYGARLDEHGNSLDPSGILVSPIGTFEKMPGVAWNGTSYLVVWVDGGSGMRAARVSPAGTLLDPVSLVPFTGGISAVGLAVASDGTNWLVSWSDFRVSAPGIYAGRVSPAGAALDPTGILLSAGSFKGVPRSAFGGGNYVVIWTESHSGFTDLYAVRLSRAGAVLDSPQIAVTTGGSNKLDGTGSYGVAYLSPSFMIVYGMQGIIYRARLNPATGAVLDTGIALTSVCCSYRPTIARDGSTALVTYAAQVGNDYQIRGTRLTPTGTDLDATDFNLATGTAILPVLAGSPEGAMLVFSRYDSTPGITSQRVRVQQVSSVPVFPLLQPPDAR
jgi:hypothetical protein